MTLCHRLPLRNVHQPQRTGFPTTVRRWRPRPRSPSPLAERDPNCHLADRYRPHVIRHGSNRLIWFRATPRNVPRNTVPRADNSAHHVVYRCDVCVVKEEMISEVSMPIAEATPARYKEFPDRPHGLFATPRRVPFNVLALPKASPRQASIQIRHKMVTPAGYRTRPPI